MPGLSPSELAQQIDVDRLQTQFGEADSRLDRSDTLIRQLQAQDVTDAARMGAIETRLTADEARIGALESPNPIFLARANGAIGSAAGAATFWMNGTSGFIASANSAVPPDGAFNWDPNDYPPAPAGKSMKWRLTGYAWTNSTPPGAVTFGLGFRRFTVGGGVGGITFTMVSNDAEARSVALPTITGGFGKLTQDSAIPAVGSFGAYFTYAATTATNSFTMLFVRLYLVYV